MSYYLSTAKMYDHVHVCTCTVCTSGKQCIHYPTSKLAKKTHELADKPNNNKSVILSTS